MFDSARTVISASISSVSVTRHAAPIQPSRRPSLLDRVEQQPQRGLAPLR
jgi:hypothetical protein